MTAAPKRQPPAIPLAELLAKVRAELQDQKATLKHARSCTYSAYCGERLDFACDNNTRISALCDAIEEHCK